MKILQFILNSIQQLSVQVLDRPCVIPLLFQLDNLTIRSENLHFVVGFSFPHATLISWIIHTTFELLTIGVSFEIAFCVLNVLLRINIVFTSSTILHSDGAFEIREISVVLSMKLRVCKC